LLVFASLTARANQVLFGPPHVVGITATSTAIRPKNSLRTYLIIQNIGALPVVVKFGSIQDDATDGVVIPAGGNYEPFLAPANSVWIRTASSTSTVVLIEGQ
jgi:hypothetical protein